MPKSDDLLNEIIARRKALQQAPEQNALERVLDDLNAFDALDQLRRRTQLCYGPKVIHSGGKLISTGVVIWRRAPGYYGYKTLSLIGLWTFHRDEQTLVAIGTKKLAFSPPFYDADAYHKLIRKDYDLYYQDDRTPPAKPAFAVRYDAEQRLDLRETVARELAREVAR